VGNGSSHLPSTIAQAREQRLGSRAIAGDREAFGELFSLHERGLYNLCYRLSGNREDAADLTQEAFLKVFAQLPRLQGRDVNLAAYLYRTARNLAYDRSLTRGREVGVEDVALVAGADEALEGDPERAALLSDQQEQVRRANSRLNERQRLALALREVEDQGYDDIGHVLEIGPDAVAQLLVRARLALGRELRLEQVDVAKLAPSCRARLGEIGALIDGELDGDRRSVLSRHLASCPDCRAAKASFEEARTSYRAWLPIGALGLGADVAKAAEGRDLLPESRGRKLSHAKKVGVGIVALIGVIVAVAVTPAITSPDQDTTPPPPQPPAPSPQPAPAVSTEEKVVRLPDPEEPGGTDPASTSPAGPVGSPPPPGAPPAPPSPGTVIITPTDVQVRPGSPPPPPAPPPVVIAPPAPPAPPPASPPAPPPATPPPAPPATPPAPPPGAGGPKPPPPPPPPPIG
jgi:RNA polymerase sigma factor (sigma-70 family)